MKSRPLIAAGAVCAAVLAAASITAVQMSAAQALPTEQPVGIVSADPSEAAAVLALMNVTSTQAIDGYTYSIGTMDGHSVVDVASGEMTDTALLATWILDQQFHPRATLWVGTSGADIAALHVGDVVIGGYVVDKTQIHYHLASELAGATSTFQTAYGGIELHTGPGTDTQGDVLSFPQKGSNIFVEAMAGSEDLADIARKADVGTNTVADATGDSSKTGTITNKVILGVAGQGNVWTEPLEQIAAQNALFPNDSEANEDPGFMWANQEAGVPSLDIRDISDTPWEPNAFDGTLASKHGAAVVRYVVDKLGPVVSTAPVTMKDLSPISAASQAGYLVADRAFYDVTQVTQIDYTSGATKVSLTGGALAKFMAQYAYGQDGL